MQSREQVFKYPNAIVRVHRPDVADDERERRMKEIKRSAEMLLREVIRNEHSTLNTNHN
jgi:hypothetical protein